MEDERQAKHSKNRGQDEARGSGSQLFETTTNNRQYEYDGLVASELEQHQRMNQSRQTTDRSRMNLLRTALEGRQYDDNEGTFEVPEISTHAAAAQPNLDTKPAAKPPKKRKHSYTPSQESFEDTAVTIARLQAENKALKEEVNDLRQENRQLRQAMHDRNNEALERNDILQNLVKQYIHRNDRERQQVARRQQRRAAAQYREPPIRAPHISEEEMQSILLEANQASRRQQRLQVPQRDFRIGGQQQRRQENELMEHLAHSFLESTRSASILSGEGVQGHDRQQPPFLSDTNDETVMRRSQGRGDNRALFASLGGRNDDEEEQIRTQLEIERVQKEIQALKRRSIHDLEDEVEELRRRKRERGL